MCLYMEGVKVSNTHELTNGLELKNGLAKKNSDLQYTQDLFQITDILKQSLGDTVLVSRLAKYHMDIREDPTDAQKHFYDFLNKHFDKIIMCERKNIFEYALSWSIRQKSGVINVYDKTDKAKVLAVSHVDEDYFLKKCKEYVNYTKWIEQYFPNKEKVTYEQMLTESDAVLEKFTGYQNSFKNKFGSHLSDIIKYEYDAFKYLTNKDKNVLNKEQIISLTKYRVLAKTMLEKKIIVSMPLKNTTLRDKQTQIKNFGACLNKFYTFAKEHNWIDQSMATFDFWDNTHVSN